MKNIPQVTIAVPSLNQASFIDTTLQSIFSQDISVEVFVLDAGSHDNTLEVIRKWESKLSGWRSYPDKGQAAAINEGIGRGKAPFVCWLNSDDFFLPGGLAALAGALESSLQSAAVYGRSWNVTEKGELIRPYPTAKFNPWYLANRCFISQPATLIRRDAWEAIGGVNTSLHMAFDYDLWWKLYKYCGDLFYVDRFVAANRRYGGTKTSTRRVDHYREAMEVVKRYYGHVPLKWYMAWPIRVTGWRLFNQLQALIKERGGAL